MPRAGLSAQAVTDAAAELADAEGLGALTLASLAARLGVRPPSLYAHVAGVEDLRARLAARGAAQLAARLQAAAAGRAGPEALAAVAVAYRAFAREHPGAYAALQRAPAPGEQAMPAAEEIVATVLAVLAGYGLAGDEALHATRAVRSALHGFVVLEAQGGFGLPLSLDDSFATLVALLDRGLRGA
ncbi:MAG TPA: TetR-like C-terminal domain-containing protein [Solirubrobacteraceae bacterium]|jgi:AcrR family transcriptional regulator|nr:TetR-like C-terminal domain-containing protein [Solirubrobacteraceae bacterium]